MLQEGEKLEDLMARFARAGRIEWIGLRPRSGGAVEAVEAAVLVEDHGLKGDHRAARKGSNRQVTLIQWEHLGVIAALAGGDKPDPSLLRRNVAVSGINLAALKDRVFRAGDALLEGTGYCHPCSRMEQNLGPGGYNAVRGHGGITARVLEGGEINKGDPIRALVTKDRFRASIS